MIRLLTFIFTLNAIFFSMNGLCLCDKNNDSDHSMMQSSISGMDEAQETVDSDDCCNTPACTNNCTSTQSLLTSSKQDILFNNPSSHPEHIFSHFYQHYLVVSSPPPLV